MVDLKFEPTSQVPPQNLDVEEAVLGGVLCDQNAFLRIKDILSASDFYLKAHQCIYSAMVDLDKASRPIDLMTVCSRLADLKLLDQVGGQSRLADLYESNPHATNIDRHAELLCRKSRDRKLIQFGHSVVALGHQSHKTEEEIGLELTEGFNRILALQTEASGELVPMSTIAQEGFDTLEKLAQDGRSPGVKTGFHGLDAMTGGGYEKGAITIMAGRPGMGKSAAAFQQAFTMARSGHSVAVFSLEMSRQSIFFRALSAESSVPSSNIQSGHLTDRDWMEIAGCYNEFVDLPLYIDDTPVGVLDIQSRVERLQQKTGKPIDVIMVDHVGLMRGIGHDPKREIANISRSLLAMAKKYNVPVVLLCQLNREVESRSDKRPVMSDLRDCGALEQDAHLIVMLYRDEYYDKNTVDRGVAELIVQKQRNGPTGVVKMLYESEFTRFRNIENCDASY